MEKILPHDDHAERALVGSILLVNDALPVAQQALRPEHFYLEAHRIVFRCIERLATQGMAFDYVTVAADLRTREAGGCLHHPRCDNELEHSGGIAWITGLTDGVPRSGNIEHYVAIVAEKSRRRRGIEAASRYVEAANDGVPEEELADYVRDIREVVEERLRRVLEPSSLAGVLNPDAWKVEYLVDRLIPAGELVLKAAEWKSGKTLLAYRLALDLATGRKVFGTFGVDGPARVGIFQWDMPHIGESWRRLCKLAVGSGLTPQDIAQLGAEGLLTLYNRPPLNLTIPNDVATFLATVRERRLSLAIVDSVGVAFAGEDQNDNSTVRRLVAGAFAPLTSEGTVVLALHHKRKRQQGTKDSDKAAVLGSQAWGAAAGRVYSLERLDEDASTGVPQPTDDANNQPPRTGEAAADPRRAFRVRLSLTGSWTPEDSPDVILAVEDSKDGEGTTIRVLDEAAQVEAGGLSSTQRAGIAFADLVKARRRISRKEALTIVGAEAAVGDTSLKKGLAYAQAKRWVSFEPQPGSRHNEQDLVPGPTLEEP